MGTDCPTATSWYWTRTHSFSSSTFIPGTTVARSWASECAAPMAAAPVVSTIKNFDRLFILTSQRTLWSKTPSNGEVEGPDDLVSQARRASNIDRVPPRPTPRASRPPPTIVRRRHRGPLSADTVGLQSTTPPAPGRPESATLIQARTRVSPEDSESQPLERH